MTKFTDRELLDMAVQCLKHARQSTAIRDCQCAACKGFMEQSEELLATIEQPRMETFFAPGSAPMPLTHWSKDPLIPYDGCKCSSCEAARAPVTTSVTDGTSE